MNKVGHALIASALLGTLGCSEPAVTADAGLDAHVHDDAHSHACVGFVVMPDQSAMLSGLVDAMHAHDGGAEDAGMPAGAHCIAMSVDPMTGFGSTADGLYTIEARSLRGAMSPEAPDNEGLSLMIRRSGAPAAGLDVRFFARMPQHNSRIAGGHGPANDFNVNGMATAPSTPGTYVVDPIDFNMAGYWLFEARFTADGAERRLYFAMETISGS